MILWLIDQQLNRINAIENFSSLVITKRYSEVSEFELHVPLTKEHLELIQNNELILGNILLKSGEKTGYLIEEISPNFQQEVSEIVIKGRDLRAYLERRILLGTQHYKDTPQNLIKKWLDESIINPVNPVRKMKAFKVGTFPETNQSINLETNYQNLLELISLVCKEFQWGFEIQMDLVNRQLIFISYTGKDRGSEQQKNSPAIFSQSFENIVQQTIVLSGIDAKTTAILEYEREEKNYLLEVTDGTADISRREIYVDAKTIGTPSAEKPISIDEQQALVKQKGNETLLQYGFIQSMEADVVTNGNLRYQQDFDLGDQITVLVDELNFKLETRIECVEEVYEKSGVEVRLTFGNKIPTLVDKIKRKGK
ncbi:siphovirus ReqiPepy6 Gp37-like family protein [Carnobacterium divergens]|uniref:siphovirus ReqiPepy6 Gp37-like family protein n=2 Tax=Carnobacterium TaxID=2747 RepID=UPI001072DE67|nr:siphovirus ReqiPepy6 Gp37-like family protein [Carnobacterium divergens]MDT1938649.1 siphovirus ReqiPepy6 Gp37-like family protein [Carnobacterium divergens]MDT1941087.1 siphovirus ReqiPepy6 Gp37-like family protein [Carnobacterium divergens]MDT1946885.1 siphovirus ReqiPepy6 Gp37-like family protein [Carnobacterium divergens]MDT1949322.1 siphovirus ReqiPepy6 Gp37-like family protein [Carnobacterium divergens]MDT1954500.1 siphovirus ReqiPepy6 Gp37-like family protein [Carnobacterium divergen